ncbi:tail fiber domain-containing protein [Candidatus Chloroploca sp. M-50]|uniref:Tail fiber domain-containing protein n=1 Tax=Candidatus Chloroploca mongolica TaxID=2528176 RepID=A0ABS4DGZ4_9CHLR|nr:tail fiber domain-containing protein [Candidatus Chloroploca mongolica]MBP1468721.1 tail fiber domain-containing protein [Candidatus Chloroploca mongolica]
MGNFSRNTFDALKHYVGVRLQQGVPLVDADWNELEDIRRFELQAFLKWFVGDGVPAGNDGFRIESTGDSLILTLPAANFVTRVYPELEVLWSEVSWALGFGPGTVQAEWNDGSSVHVIRAARRDGSPVQLISTNLWSMSAEQEAWLHNNDEPLLFRIRPHDQAPWTRFTATIGSSVGYSIFMEAINSATRNPADPDPGIVVSAAISAANDFVIKGGDGTPSGAGRCLVDGWDVINESSLTYTAQPLYNNSTRAALWGVDPLLPLNAASNRTDLVYLDVWEREVVGDDDRAHMINPVIGIETCVRIKREWVVRVAEGVAEDTKAIPQNLRRAHHAYYPLARLHRKAGQAGIGEIDDLRRTELGVLSEALTIKDGKVGIGTDAPEMPLHIIPSRPATGIRLDERGLDDRRTGRFFKMYYEGQGTMVLYHNNGLGQYVTQDGKIYQNSDLRLKKDITPLTCVLQKVLELKPVHFSWRKHDSSNIGFVAQDVEQVFPELVTTVNLEDGPTLGLPYASFGVLAIAALQELAQKYEHRIAALEKQLASGRQ